MSETVQHPTKKLSLFHLTWPIFLEIFLFMLMGVADTFMLASVSDDAVSGVGTANQFIQIAILILGVVGSGASIVVSQYLGSRQFLEASKISALAITLNICVGFVISIIFILTSNYLMIMMNLQGDVLEYAESYLIIVGGAIFFTSNDYFPSCYYPSSWMDPTNDVCFSWNEYHSCRIKLHINFR